MKKILTTVTLITSSLLITCSKESDPKPDLSSAKLTLNWNFPTPVGPQYGFYAIVSDTSGNIVTWKEIITRQPNELPYPPDPGNAILTIVAATSVSGQKSTYVSMFAGVPAGEYTFTPEPATDRPAADGFVKLSIADNPDNGDYIAQYMSGEYESRNFSGDGNIENYSYGVYKNKVNNLLLYRQASDTEYQYTYYPAVVSGDSIGVSLDSFISDATLMPAHDISYPQFNESDSIVTWITGITDNNGSFILSSTPTNNSSPIAFYPEIDNLFPQYETELNAFTPQGVVNILRYTGTTPHLTFSNLTSVISAISDHSTNRISIDLTGTDGTAVYLEDRYGSANDNVLLQVFAQKSQKIRLNLPRFSQDIITQIPSLDLLKDKSINYFYIDEYQISYSGLFKFWVESGFNAYMPTMRSKGFMIGNSGGRVDGIKNRFTTAQKAASKLRALRSLR